MVSVRLLPPVAAHASSTPPAPESGLLPRPASLAGVDDAPNAAAALRIGDVERTIGADAHAVRAMRRFVGRFDLRLAGEVVGESLVLAGWHAFRVERNED